MLGLHRGAKEGAVARGPAEAVLELGGARRLALGLGVDDEHELLVEVGRLLDGVAPGERRDRNQS